ncbi:MAG: hypothetical protein F4Y44_00185 [Chloroflexi bacterium]|nr:hypothetical protein [Chloroflexota bacterium]
MIIRLASATVGLPLIIFVVWYGPPEQKLYWFTAFIFIVCVIATIETWLLVRRWTSVFHVGFPVILTAFMMIGAQTMAVESLDARPEGLYDRITRFYNEYLLAIVSCGLTYILLITRNERADEDDDAFSEYPKMRMRFPITTTLAVSHYAAGFLFYAPMLRNLEQGREWVFLLLAVVFATDTSAYLVGRAIGKTPLAPNISPNKTREGSVAGMVGAVAACVLANSLLGLNVIIWQALLLGALIGALAQIGDLVESRLKRKAGVKDSGFLIPGHGGILDRIDSIALAVPATYYFVIWIVQ